MSYDPCNRDWGLRQRIFNALRPTEGRSARDIAEEVQAKAGDHMVIKTLYDLRNQCIASSTGNTWKQRWFLVPGAKIEPDRRGSNPRSRANLSTRKKQEKPPALTWANLLK